MILQGNQGYSWLVTLLLAIFLGEFGIHRFYTGNYIKGILLLITFGGFGVWYFVDIALILLDFYHDSEGRKLVK